MKPDPIVRAREIVAARFNQPYHVNAIMRGEWDNGALIREALASVQPNTGTAMFDAAEGDE
ncbi:hypothetical protein [Sphingobium sp. HDIP04]|uniref:hypothetical protein n=1 Tax=Sphingobium sp. HDIP04 TaxID=428994 RepID=UPI000387940A|nr:hypothetical protein [Sphingobium sp. HDIP04]EQB03904.1 hypothetical protein L286_11100 [Sphingobium sp. HDIP04]